MKMSSSARYPLIALAAVALTLSATPFAVAAARAGEQNPGGVRGSASSAGSVVGNTATTSNLNISITYQGKPVYQAKVSIASPKGAVVASGLTTKSGLFTASVGAGSYAVAASSNGHVASNSVTVGASAKSVSLTLQ
jgi:hypothetical protein